MICAVFTPARAVGVVALPGLGGQVAFEDDETEHIFVFPVGHGIAPPCRAFSAVNSHRLFAREGCPRHCAVVIFNTLFGYPGPRHAKHDA